jgi:cytochrome o ubiquinol oxidase subunit 2
MPFSQTLPSHSLRTCLACGAGLWLVGCDEGVLDPQGPVSAAERLILFNATAIMLVVVIPVILTTLAFAWWYRAGNTRAAYTPDWAYSGKIELVVWSIPAMVVILLAGVTWIGAHELDPRATLDSRVAPLNVEVVSLDWKWLFIYPDLEVATVNDLVLPTGVPVKFVLTSATVMSAFFVPQLGSQVYTMPGMTTHLNLMADRPGDFAGLSSHFNGNGFSDMHFIVHALPPAQFQAWLTQTRAGAAAGVATGGELDLRRYDRLSQPGNQVGSQTYGSIAPDLFNHILKASAPAVPTGVDR